MSNVHLVTGYAGQAHVTAADDGSFNTAIFGVGQYVLNIGNKLAASVVTNNKITVSDGDILMQGRHIRLNEGSTVDLTIDNGAQGKLRNDLIVARYTKDAVSGVEEVNLVVIKGTAVDSDPADPEYTSGDIINDHALLNDMPLYRVPLNGLTVGTLTPLFSVADLGGLSLKQLWENASPTSQFPAQTVSLDLTEYPYLVIMFARSSEEISTNGFWGELFEKGVPGYVSGYYSINGSGHIRNAYRRFTISNTGVTFEVGKLKDGYTDEAEVSMPQAYVPYKIFGLKGVQ